MSIPSVLSFSAKADVLAIVGMDIALRGCSDLGSFKREVYRGKNPFSINPDKSTADLAEETPSLDSEKLIKRTIFRAIMDIRLEHQNLSIVLIINAHRHYKPGIELSRWVHEHINLDGVLIPQADEKDTLADCLHQARQITQSDQRTMVALVDFIPNEGCAVLVLASANAVLQFGLRPYAWIQSAEECSPAFPDGIARTCSKAFKEAYAKPEEIGYLELTGNGENILISDNFPGITQFYQQANSQYTCAISELNTNLLYTGVVKAAVCLSERILPCLPRWHEGELLPAWENSSFYLLEESQTWFTEKTSSYRKAAVGVFDGQGNFTHIIMKESASHDHPILYSVFAGEIQLLLLTGSSQQEIVSKVLDCQKSLLVGIDVTEISRRLYLDAKNRDGEDFCLALIGLGTEDLLSEINFALKGVPAAFDKNTEWQTPAGSYFTPDPQGNKGKVAFVYPGAFNSSLGMGRDLFYLFTQLHEDITCLTEDIAAAMHTRQLYPRSMEPLKKEQVAKLEAELLDDPVTMLTSGTGFAVLYTLILKNILSIMPEAAFGYSFGENSLMYACEIWGNADEARRLLEASPLFHNRLAGRQDAIRQFWGIPPLEAEENRHTPLWANYLLMATPQKVINSLEGEERVYLTHINTPRQTVIGGDPAACKRVIEKMGCTYMKMPFNYAMHCPPASSEYATLFELHYWSVQQKPDFPIFLSADFQPVRIDQDVIADKIAQGLGKCVDFAEMTRRVYDAGARIFIELGAGNNCSKWIDDTLRLSPHVSVAINRPGVDDLTSILRLAARLSSHRVKLDLSTLYIKNGKAWEQQ